MGLEAVSRLFGSLGLTRAPSEAVLPPLRPEDICTSDPERRVPAELLGQARPQLAAHTHGLQTRSPSRARVTWTPQQYERFAVRVREYLAQNPTLLAHHAAWHEINGPGGTRGEGSGSAFLQMHHEMIVTMEQFITASGRDLDLVPLVEWRPSQVVPPQLGDFKRNSVALNVQLPPWLTTAGSSSSTAPFNGPPTAPIFGYTKLGDFKSLDELGRALGSGFPDNLGYHGAGHAAAGAVMWSRSAPEDPVFWLWHRHIDNIVETWIATPNGRAWAATPEGQAWRSATGHHHEVFSSDDLVGRRTGTLLRMRRDDPAGYERYMSSSSFEAQANTWPADALGINVVRSERLVTRGVTVQTLATGLRLPTGLTFASNGNVYFTERNGSTRIIRNGFVQEELVAPPSIAAAPPASPEQIASVREMLRDAYGLLGDIVQGPDGYIYVTTANRRPGGTPAGSDDQILRIIPTR